MNKKIQVHIADDHKILIEGIIAVINTDDDIEVVGYSLTGKEVLEWLQDNTADVLILDINMPVVGGIEVLKNFKKNKIDQKVIVLSSYDDVKFVQEIISRGADGFLSKTSAGNHIVEAIKTVHKGEQYFSSDIKDELFKLILGQKVKIGERPDNKETSSLTDREIDVLRLIAQEHSTAEIADILHLSVYTVETYRKNLLKKTNVKNVVGLAKYALKYDIT
jgi:DNA-binding NarL/FixJ family response regulator